MQVLKRGACLLALVSVAAWPAAASAYDLDNGNAAFDLVIQTAAPVIFQDVSPTGGDSPLVLRATTGITNAWYDATAPYNYPAVGVYTRLGWPNGKAAPASNAAMNVALLYASYRVLVELLPRRAETWRDMLIVAGLDPDDDSTDPTSPVGIGNLAGMGVVEGRRNDGMNQVGNADGRMYNYEPFSDYTGYQPVNTAYKLFAPSRWQPDVQRVGLGIYKVQQFVTPQWALVEPYAYADPNVYTFPVPINSKWFFKKRYRQQADEVLAASAALDDEKKLTAELFDDKIRGLGFAAVFAALSQGMSLFEFVQFDFLTNMAAFDAGIVVWREKRVHDAVRPFSAIRFLYGDKLVQAWGGPGQGTQSLPASEWKSYLEEADHPEYPSASTCFCAAHAQSARRFQGNDTLGWPVEFPAGSSRIEPGITPASDTTLFFPTWTDWAADCGQSRVWAGVHFQAAVDEAAAVCPLFGDLAYDYLVSLVNGTAPPRGPSQGAPVP
jgi:hypothetical protein